ncbi:MAG: oligoendopeptidase F [Anaerotardibacter sp.]
MIYENRSDIDPQYTWDLSSIFSSDEAFLEALEELKTYPEKFAAFEGTLATSASNLLAYCALDDEADVKLGKLFNYAQRKSDEDTRVALYQDYQSQVMNAYVALASSQAWFTSELLSISEETMDAFYAQEPGLELYRRAFDRIFANRAHILSKEEEALLAGVGDIASQPENIFSQLNDADLTFEDALDSKGQPHPVTHGSYVPLLSAPDRELRKNAFTSMYKAYGSCKNTCAAVLGAQTKQLHFFSKARKHESSLAYSLNNTEVPVEVYTNLIAAVRNNLNHLHMYVGLRKKLLGLDDLHFYDLYTPMVEDLDMTFTYEEACEIILKALEPMGEEYLSLVRKGLSERWIDVYENKGKRSGAYSAGGYGMHPVILLNFQGKLDDVFTLIHEMGHSIHTYLSCQEQPSCYSSYVIFVAEVASTCNEALLMQYFLNTTTDPKQKAYLLNHFLEQFRGTLYRQTMFAEFELAINELTAKGNALTSEALCQMYKQLNVDYFGPEIVVDGDIALEWARIPHFYYNYYVYQYATGYAAAIALSQRILNGGESAVQDYLGFLKGGNSKPPIDLLKGAGVDMATTQPIESALSLFGELLEEMEALVQEF